MKLSCISLEMFEVKEMNDLFQGHKIDLEKGIPSFQKRSDQKKRIFLNFETSPDDNDDELIAN